MILMSVEVEEATQGTRLAFFGAEYRYHSPPKTVCFSPISEKIPLSNLKQSERP